MCLFVGLLCVPFCIWIIQITTTILFGYVYLVSFSVLCIHFPQDTGKKMVYKLFPKTSSENNSFFRMFLI